MDVKRQLVQGYGNSYGNTYDVLDNDKLKKKIQICEELLDLYSKFHPGYNYDAAMLHYEDFVGWHDIELDMWILQLRVRD